MSLRNLFAISAVYFGAFGLASLIVPDTLLSLVYYAEAGEVATWSIRFAGVPWLGFAALTWFARDAEDSAARRAILLALVVFFAISTILPVMGALSAVGPPALWWADVGLYLLFMLTFAYLGFVKTSES